MGTRVATKRVLKSWTNSKHDAVFSVEYKAEKVRPQMIVDDLNTMLTELAKLAKEQGFDVLSKDDVVEPHNIQEISKLRTFKLGPFQFTCFKR